MDVCGTAAVTVSVAVRCVSVRVSASARGVSSLPRRAVRRSVRVAHLLASGQRTADVSTGEQCRLRQRMRAEARRRT